MRLRHAVALGMLTWWLILPPMTADRSRLRADVPLVQWPVFGKFDSEQDCEKQEVWLGGYLDGHLRSTASNRDNLLRQMKNEMRCLDVPEIAPE